MGYKRNNLMDLNDYFLLNLMIQYTSKINHIQMNLSMMKWFWESTAILWPGPLLHLPWENNKFVAESSDIVFRAGIYLNMNHNIDTDTHNHNYCQCNYDLLCIGGQWSVMTPVNSTRLYHTFVKRDWCTTIYYVQIHND